MGTHSSKKEYYDNNREAILAQQKLHRQQTKERYNSYQRRYQAERKKTDPIYKMITNLRTRTYALVASKGFSKKSGFNKYLGCSTEKLKKHLEAQFQPGMTWDNYGEWHVDHVYPLSRASTIVKLEKLCHYSNLQPLWASDNLSKSDNI
jgi:predicted PolB exonuclease-like 3'-5' exonuclease